MQLEMISSQAKTRRHPDFCVDSPIVCHHWKAVLFQSHECCIVPCAAYAAARTVSFRRFKCAASFFFELNTRHCTVPIGIALAAAIS